MSAPIVQSDYEAMEQIARRFQQENQQLLTLKQRVDRGVGALRNGGWQGAGSAAFAQEMDNEVTPATQRLIEALAEARQVTLQVNALIRAAEEEAASVFRGERHGGRGNGAVGLDGLGGALPWGNGSITPMGIPDPSSAVVPPPRVYLINGINNTGNGMQEMERLLEARGGDPSQVQSTPAIYVAPLRTDLAGTYLRGTDLQGTNLQGTDYKEWYAQPLNWISGGAASAVNGLTSTSADAINIISGGGATAINTVTGGIAGGINKAAGFINTAYGSGQTAVEYITGGSTQTDRVRAYIQEDLRRNPLLPGQTITFVAHSGGGAVAPNLASIFEGQMVTRIDGSNSTLDVQSVVTMGSPLVNRDAANRVANLVEIRENDDWVGLPWIRSSLSRVTWPSPKALVLGEIFGRSNTQSYVYDEPTANSILEGHGSYFHSSEVVDILRRELTNGAQPKPSPL